MNCKQVADRLHFFLDRELSTPEIEEVTEHLERCPGCFELVRFESGIIRLVRKRCSSERAPDALKSRIGSIPRSS